MKNIVILGNSIAAVKAMEHLRREDTESRIICVDPEAGIRPYHRERLASWVGKEISQDEVFYQSVKFYKNLNVEFVSAKIQRVSLRRKKITLEEQKELLEFDVLIIADLGVDQLPEVKGNYRQGFHRAHRMQDICALMQRLPLIDTIIVQGSDELAAQLAQALVVHKKEVVWVGGQGAERESLRVMEGHQVAEILGDTDVKAVRLQSGKIIGCQEILWSGLPADLRLLKDSELIFEDGKLQVNEFGQTNLEGIFALSSEVQGEKLGEFLLRPLVKL